MEQRTIWKYWESTISTSGKIKSATGLTAQQRKKVQAPFSPLASVWTPSSMESNGSFPLVGRQMVVSRNQQKWATTRFSWHTHIWKPQGSFAIAGHPQKANRKRRQVWAQPPCLSLQRPINPGSRDGTYEYNGEKHAWQIWENNSKRQTYSRPELEMVLRHFCKQLCSKRHLQACWYGFCIHRLIIWAIAARRKYPGQLILATKNDYKPAYRQGILHFATALQTATQLPEEDLTIITLQLTFGGAPCPFEWKIMSELMCNLANKLLKC